MRLNSGGGSMTKGIRDGGRAVEVVEGQGGPRDAGGRKPPGARMAEFNRISLIKTPMSQRFK